MFNCQSFALRGPQHLIRRAVTEQAGSETPVFVAPWLFMPSARRSGTRFGPEWRPFPIQSSGMILRAARGRRDWALRRRGGTTPGPPDHLRRSEGQTRFRPSLDCCSYRHNPMTKAPAFAAQIGGLQRSSRTSGYRAITCAPYMSRPTPPEPRRGRSWPSQAEPLLVRPRGGVSHQGHKA